MPRVIGVTGLAQHGKNSAAEFIKEYYDGQARTEIMAFADPMREMASALGEFVQVANGINYNKAIRMYGYEMTKEYFPTARSFIQALGTEAGRKILGKDVWINAMDKRITESTADIIVIADVRFQNEVDFIRRRGGKLWAVIRPGFKNKVGTSHSSESYIATAMRQANYTIIADDLDELKEMVWHHLDVIEEHGDIIDYDHIVPF